MSRHVATPEQELCFAVVKLAVEDLKSSNEEDRYEAHEFLFQKRGGWADMRRMYFALIGLDEDSVQERLAPHYDPPERPEKKWSQMDVYEVLPEGEFTAITVANVVGLRYSQISTRFQHLMQMGLIIRVGRGLFVRADCYDAVAVEPEPEPFKPEPTQKSQAQLLDALRDGPKTIREMIFAFDGEIGQDAIRQRLERAQARNLVTKEGAAWRIAA